MLEKFDCVLALNGDGLFDLKSAAKAIREAHGNEKSQFLVARTIRVADGQHAPRYRVGKWAVKGENFIAC